MINPVRGEVEIVLTEHTLLLRPTFHALCTLEQVTGNGIYEIAKRFEDGRFTLTDMVSIITTATVWKTNDEILSRKQLGEAILNVGVAKLVKPISQYLLYALGGLHAPTAKDDEHAVE